MTRMKRHRRPGPLRIESSRSGHLKTLGDLYQAWYKERVTVDPAQVTNVSDLYADFQSYLADLDDARLLPLDVAALIPSCRGFGMMVTRRSGHEPVRSHGRSFRRGIALKPWATIAKEASGAQEEIEAEY